MFNYLDFEKPVADLEGKILELKKLTESGEAVDVADEIARLEKRSQEALRDIYRQLTPWQKVQVARHPDRPHCLDYVRALFTDFTPLAGDRAFAEDQALVAGFARFRGEPVAVLGLEKGNDTQTRLKHNFGSARPEGYRKAVRVMELADRFAEESAARIAANAEAYFGVGDAGRLLQAYRALYTKYSGLLEAAEDAPAMAAILAREAFAKVNPVAYGVEDASIAEDAGPASATEVPR